MLESLRSLPAMIGPATAANADSTVSAELGRLPRIHFHTDCPWFAGCETMLANLLKSPAIRERFAVSFSYRASERYTEGMRQRIRVDFPLDALAYPEPSYAIGAFRRMPAPLGRVGRVISRFITTIPLLVYEIFVLYRVFRVRRPEILHVNNGGYPAALSARAAVIAGRLAGVPHVLMAVNNLAEDYASVARRLEYPLDRVVVACVTAFTTGSEAAAARLRQVLQLGDDRAVALTNGGDLRETTESVAQTRERLGLAGYRGVVLGIVGLLEARKGHQVLLEAVGMLARNRRDRRDPPPFVLLILGDGSLRGQLERYVRDEGLDDYCRFLDHESNGLNVINALDVLVLASVGHEDFPNVILEAMGTGKPVVSTRVAGTPELVVDGVTGLLVDPGDAPTLAAAIDRLCADPAERVRLGRAGLARFETRFTADAASRRYAALYERLLSSG